MSPDLAVGLRALAQALPAGTPIPVPAEVLLELLDGDGAATPDAPAPDFTVAQVAERFGRAPSTIRGWVAAGHLTGAYHFRGRELRIPAAAVLAFEEHQRGPAAVATTVAKPRSRRREPDLGAWRGLAS